MQHSSEKSQANQDGWENGEDSSVMTIEYLRARLLSERSISKATKERADELSRRVNELEDQLKNVSLQRKRAEKATLDVLSYLESHGVSDISDLYESESDQEDSLCESNMGRSNENKNFVSLELKENGNEDSGSDHEPAPSSTGSLSWKGKKKTAQHFEPKYFDSLSRRQTNSSLMNSSPRRRHGKSCRQIKRREMRSAVEEPSHDPLKPNIQDSNSLDISDHHANCLDTKNDKFKQSPTRRVERDFKMNEASILFEDRTQASDASSSNRGHERNGEMERALKHQAQLIGIYEAQEKAQRDWEDKYGDNHVSTQDSCEPGSHSDVTEERDENKAGVHHHGNDQKEGSETNFQSKQSSLTHYNSFKFSPNDKLTEMKSSRSPPLDFAFPTVSNNQTLNHVAPKIALSSDVNGNRSIVPHEEPQRPDSILSALQEAKLILKQQMGSLVKSSKYSQKDFQPSVSAVNDCDWLNIPVTCPSLFRVPTDLPSQAPSHSKSLVPDNARHFSDSYGFGRNSHLQGYPYMSSPMDSRVSTVGHDTYSGNPAFATELSNSKEPRRDYQSNTNLASSSVLGFLPYANFPDFLQSPDQMFFGQTPRSEVGVPPQGNLLFYNHDVRSNMY